MALNDTPGIQSVVKRWPLRHRTTVSARIKEPRRRATTTVSAQSSKTATTTMTLRRMASQYSATAIDGDLERFADLAHPLVAEPTETLGEDCDRDALDRVEIHR
jgi:hypothetical protein